MYRKKWLVVMVLAGILILGACGSKEKTKEKAEKKTNVKPKLDCKKICNRTFGTCLEEVLVSTGKVTKKQIKILKKTGALKKAIKAGKDKCLQNCNDKKGQEDNNAEKIQHCMKKESCAEYAKCIKGHLF